MSTKTLPLKEKSINELFNGESQTFEVPIYQRNYAWNKDEIFAMIQDIWDACDRQRGGHRHYYMGTLVTFHRGEQVYEIIDGQQRLTTIVLALKGLNIETKNKLTYRARKKSNDTISAISGAKDGSDVPEALAANTATTLEGKVDEIDYGIIEGFTHVLNALKEIVPLKDLEDFKQYFKEQVRLIHYQVPKDVDLNHYFEIMNSRGEQLEKHEIIKARLMNKLSDEDKSRFHFLWEHCSAMNVYIQQKYSKHIQQKDSKDQGATKKIFGKDFSDFPYHLKFEDLPLAEEGVQHQTISELIEGSINKAESKKEEAIDSFQPIIDFANFLLLVLKLMRIKKQGFVPADFNLDDKELLNEFDDMEKDTDIDADFVKKFGLNLLKAKFLLDNYVVHHAHEEDTISSNPWKLQYWQSVGAQAYLKNLAEEEELQDKLVHLLSMFEVAFSPRQRKNYLFYCLLKLFELHKEKGYSKSSVEESEPTKNDIIEKYSRFLSDLADKYFFDIYLVREFLNEINTPKPGTFDRKILHDKKMFSDAGEWVDVKVLCKQRSFTEIYENKERKSRRIPLFVFNYLDYKLWEKYRVELRGQVLKKDHPARKGFFEALGCSDFGLDVFRHFYFSRTRGSLEHFYPQANVGLNNGAPTTEEINCLGNYAMIGSEANSAGSNWSPKAKLEHYLDPSGKIKQVSVASLKFMLMMQICKDNYDQVNGVRGSGEEWVFKDIKEHQTRMLKVLELKKQPQP